jgi:hypothetical protein
MQARPGFQAAKSAQAAASAGQGVEALDVAKL